MSAKRKTLAIELLVILLAVLAYGAFLAITAPKPTPTPIRTVTLSPAPTPAPPTTAELLKLVNIERAKKGVAPLVDDPRLDQSAQRKAQDMVQYKYYDHVSPHDGEHGYQYAIDAVPDPCSSTASENILRFASGYKPDDNSAYIIKSWVDSPAHYSAMVNPKYTITGLAIDGLYAVEHFC